MKSFFKTALVLLGCFGIAHQALAIEITCPPTMRESASVQEAAVDWETIEEAAERPLDQVSLYLHHPSKKGSLVPDVTKRERTEERVTWKLVRGPRDEYWLACSYHGTTALFARRLDNGLSRCVVRYALLPSGERSHLKAATCE